MKTRPEVLLQAMAPSRAALVVAVACLLPWYGLAALCAQEPLAFVLGHARYRQALHGGKAQNDTLDSQPIAGLRRGARLPPASVSPAAMRATRAGLRRRFPLTRQRAALLAHVPPTHRQYHLPEIGKPLASQANRDGGAERCPAPAVPKSVAVDLARIDSSDRRRRDGALTLVQTAKAPQAPALYRRQAVPGIGPMVRVVRRDDSHDLHRCPSVQDCVSSGRLVTGAKASAGQRAGTASAQSGKTHRTWACSAAAVWLLRHHPAAQTYLACLAPTPGQGQAFPLVAPP
jgi:hypothetical protein